MKDRHKISEEEQKLLKKFNDRGPSMAGGGENKLLKRPKNSVASRRKSKINFSMDLNSLKTQSKQKQNISSKFDSSTNAIIQPPTKSYKSKRNRSKRIMHIKHDILEWEFLREDIKPN